MSRSDNTSFFIAVLLICLAGGHVILPAQSYEVKLGEVQIRASRKSYHSSDLHTVRIDTILKTKYFGTDLSEILRRETNLNITQYGGQGSLASIRLRGSAPSQTQINWNGIPVNSPTTGSIDLSLLAGGMADAIDIAYGAGGSLFGNGTFGGSINLFNQPDWDNRLSVNIAAEAGSWNHFKSGAKVSAGSEKWQYNLTGSHQSSENAYPFRNTFKSGDPVEYRKNDAMNLLAFQQHIFIRLPKNWQLQYGAWWYQRDKKLPAAMGSTPVIIDSQTDRSIRQFIRTTKWYNKSSFEILAAYFSDSLLFSERNLKNDSLTKSSGIRSTDTYLSLFHRWSVSKYFSLENGADFEYQTAKVGSYNGLATESRGAVFSLVKFMARQFSANLSCRQVFYSIRGPKPLFSASIQYRLPVNGISIKAQVSNKFRLPTLNDRYWQPGGNPELLPETGLGCDLGLNWDRVTSGNSSLNLSTLLYIQQIDNWIQWVPTGTYWSPQNIKMVKCQGLELSLTGRMNIGSVGLTAKTMYSYTESLDMGLPNSDTRLNRQLAYVPLHLLKAQAGLSRHRFEATIGYRYTGRRYTTDDHDPWLELGPVHLADLSMGYAFSAKRNRIMVTAGVTNLFDAGYQMIRAYPAPGRSFYLTANYLFNKKAK